MIVRVCCVLVLCIVLQGDAYNLVSHKFPLLKRITTSSLIASFILCNNPVNIYSAHAGAIEAATRNMMEGSEKKVKKQELSFDQLPTDGAKRRAALSYCKNDSLRSAARYSSTSECTQDVLNGNYAIANPPTVRSQSNAKESTTTTASSATTNGEASSKEDASSRVTAVASTPRKKVVDLSDLNENQKKRRSLAACKNKDIRVAARMGTESKCTAAVMKGDYDSLIDALEYVR